MRNPPPRSVAGKPETNWFRVTDKFFDEVKNTVDGLTDQIATAITSALTGAISAASLKTAEADVRHAVRQTVLPGAAAQANDQSNVTLNASADITATLMTSGTAAAAASYNTGTVTPTGSGKGYLCFFASAAPTVPGVGAVTGLGLTWTRIAVVGGGAQACLGGMYFAKAAFGATPTPGALTLTPPTGQAGAWVVAETDGFLLAGTIVRGNGSNNATAVTANPITLAANVDIFNTYFGWNAITINATQTLAGWTKIGEAQSATLSIAAWVRSGLGAAVANPSPSWAGAANTAGDFAELQGRSSGWVRTNSKSAVDSRATLPFQIDVGERITQVDVKVRHAGVGFTVTVALCKVPSVTGAPPTILGLQTSSAGAASDETLSISGLTETVAAGSAYMIEFLQIQGGADGRLYEGVVSHDRP